MATGFPYHDPRLLPQFRPVLDRALATFEDRRRPGSASLDLTYTAQATFDCFFERGLILCRSKSVGVGGSADLQHTKPSPS
jgi:myo-inositol-1(or 4)-monophosphatase